MAISRTCDALKDRVVAAGLKPEDSSEYQQCKAEMQVCAAPSGPYQLADRKVYTQNACYMTANAHALAIFAVRQAPQGAKAPVPSAVSSAVPKTPMLPAEPGEIPAPKICEEESAWLTFGYVFSAQSDAQTCAEAWNKLGAKKQVYQKKVQIEDTFLCDSWHRDRERRAGFGKNKKTASRLNNGHAKFFSDCPYKKTKVSYEVE